MEQNKSSAKRIQWLDICRGILIILMVTGHSTGLFNKYIYQFHMAAFFFLSGYMSQPEKRGMFQTLFDKFFTVLLPAVTTVMMPGIDGISACLQIREKSRMPIIFMSAKSEDIDIIQGLTVGGDDYVTKPFQPIELLARIKAQLRRYKQYNETEKPAHTLQVG